MDDTTRIAIEQLRTSINLLCAGMVLLLVVEVVNLVLAVVRSGNHRDHEQRIRSLERTIDGCEGCHTSRRALEVER